MRTLLLLAPLALALAAGCRAPEPKGAPSVDPFVDRIVEAHGPGWYELPGIRTDPTVELGLYHWSEEGGTSGGPKGRARFEGTRVADPPEGAFEPPAGSEVDEPPE